jgi:hypothetical protein
LRCASSLALARSLAIIPRPDDSNLDKFGRIGRAFCLAESIKAPVKFGETFAIRRRYLGMTQPDIWYVAFGPDKTVKTDDNAATSTVRSTRTFKTEVDAKLFAMQILAKGWTASAGTLNPHQPKQVVGPADVERWADPGLGG